MTEEFHKFYRPDYYPRFWDYALLCGSKNMAVFLLPQYLGTARAHESDAC
jgi:hypothetical protein